MKTKIILLMFLSSICHIGNGQNFYMGKTLRLETIYDTCKNTDSCSIMFSEKYLIALNYIVQKDSVLKNKKIKISETPAEFIVRFNKILDSETLKIFYDSINSISYHLVYIGYKFIFPKFINIPKPKINGTLYFSKIINNYLFFYFEPCCFSEKEKYILKEDQNYFREYCVKFNECGGIDKVYTKRNIERIPEWDKNKSYIFYEIVEL